MYVDSTLLYVLYGGSVLRGHVSTAAPADVVLLF